MNLRRILINNWNLFDKVIMKNKYYIIPHMLTFCILWLILLIPIPKIYLVVAYIPVFFYLFFRSYLKVNDGHNPFLTIVTIVIILPFIVGILFWGLFILISISLNFNPFG